MFFKLVSILSISLLTAALPFVPFGINVEGPDGPLGTFAGCPVAHATLTFPDQAALSIPPGQVPGYILLGTGVQNYTCGDSGTHTTAGAVAKLYDISCLFGTPAFDTIQDDCLSHTPTEQQLFYAGFNTTPFFVADHYFIANSTGTGISPKFASASNGGASFIVAAKVAGIHAPDPTNVDWLQLANIRGDFAKTVFRVDTKAGQPPTSCTPGSDPISVPYAAKYWFFA